MGFGVGSNFGYSGLPIHREIKQTISSIRLLVNPDPHQEGRGGDGSCLHIKKRWIAVFYVGVCGGGGGGDIESKLV